MCTPHTDVSLRGSCLATTHTSTQDGKGARHATGPCSRWETLPRVRVGVGRERRLKRKFFCGNLEKKKNDPEFSQLSKGAKSFKPHHTRAPPPHKTPGQGFPPAGCQCQGKGRGKETAREWNGTPGRGGRGWKGEEIALPGNRPGARALVTSSQATSNTDL